MYVHMFIRVYKRMRICECMYVIAGYYFPGWTYAGANIYRSAHIAGGTYNGWGIPPRARDGRPGGHSARVGVRDQKRVNATDFG